MSSGSTPTVLVVDDELSNLVLAERVLAAGGYKVTTAGTAAEALRAIEAHGGFSLYVLDVMLPGVRGTELAGRFGPAIRRPRFCISPPSATRCSRQRIACCATTRRFCRSRCRTANCSKPCRCCCSDTSKGRPRSARMWRISGVPLSRWGP